REVISLHIGQAGVQAGSRLWELYCLEHGICPGTGMPISPLEKLPGQSGVDGFFQVTSGGAYQPRALMMDTDPSTVNAVSRSSLRSLFGHLQLVEGREDSGNNFARGYCGPGRSLWSKTSYHLRRLAEAADSFQGFVVQHAMGGGTGAGFGAYTIQEISKKYPKKNQIVFSVFPSPCVSTATVEPYNALLFAHFTSEGTENGCFLTDNQAVYGMCNQQLGIASPKYSDLNRILAQTLSTVTSSFRFDGPLKASFRDLQTNLIPTPRLKYPVLTYAPIVGHRKDGGWEDLSTSDVAYMCFVPSNLLVVCDPRAGRYLCLCLAFRGDVSPREVNRAVSRLAEFDGIRFASWAPGTEATTRWGFRVPPKAACCLANTTAVREAWSILSDKFETLLSKKAFVHWYLQEGLEMNDFRSALETARDTETEYKLAERG
ncbi:hypothetical protein AAG570_004597, partial [Ranatra chinensis]